MLKQKITTETKGDTIFLNVNLSNPQSSNQLINASISSTLRNPILDTPSDYDLIISRFSIPGRATPLFFFETNPFPNTNVNQGIYSVVIEYQGQLSDRVFLNFTPETLTPPNIPVFSALVPNQNPNDLYYYAYSYQNLANMITTAIKTAIGTAPFLPPDTDAYCIYNNLSGFFSFLGTKNMFSSNDPLDPNNVRIWLNTPLANFFTGLRTIHNTYNGLDGKDEMLLISNERNNDFNTQDGFNPNIPDGYYQTQLEFNSDSSLESLTRIIICSNGFGGVVSQAEVSDANSQGTYRNVLADFLPTVSTSNGSYRTKFQYFAQSEFFRRTLTQKLPLDTLQMDFFWQGIKPGLFRPLVLEPGDVLSIQFIFQKTT